MFPRLSTGTPRRSINENQATQPTPTSARSESRKSIIVVPPTKLLIPDDVPFVECEQTEIAAQITIPPDGGWGWVVVAASFSSIFILDGVSFTFGSILHELTEEFKVDESLIALVNSMSMALYCSCAPFASAAINRFGFRTVIMSGATISSLSLFCAYFVEDYVAFCVFYGGFAGVGYCFINMSAALVVGFYFEKLRSLAIAIATNGSSVGVMVMFPVNTYLVKLSGWRTLTLLHSGLFGVVYFLGMTFKPLFSLTVTQTTDEPARTVTYLPTLPSERSRAESVTPTPTEKLFGALSNYNFPTAAVVINEGILINTADNQVGVPGPSKQAPLSKLTISASGMSQQQVKQVRSIMSKTGILDKTKTNIELTIKAEESIQKVSCWKRICDWEEHKPQSRPMYRDDIFYDGKLKSLPTYRKSVMDIPESEKLGIEYQLAVSRAATAEDLEENWGVCTTATRRILATMMDPKLLKRCSFLMFGVSAFLIYLGFLVPYTFIQARNRAAGIDELHCGWFVSVIGFSNAVGRLSLGALACKVDPLKLFILALLTSGTVIAMSNLSFNLYYQYLCWVIFGIFIGSIACLRSMVLVELYGLEKLTNATGIMLFFQGIGCCISTPAASIVKSMFGFSYAFYYSAFFVFLSGLCVIPVKSVCKREENK